MLRFIININGIKTNYHIFFKNFVNKSILVNKLEETKFLDLKYRKKTLKFLR